MPETPREFRCPYCGKPVHEEDGWWLDEEGDQVCENAAGELGPHGGEPVGE